jgi:hypothetical protein
MQKTRYQMLAEISRLCNRVIQRAQRKRLYIWQKEKQEISYGSSDKVFFMRRFLQDFIFSVPSVPLW